MQQVTSQPATPQLTRRTIAKQPQFSGLAHVEPIADKQEGPSCGFEAIENIIQLFHRLGNDLTRRELLPLAQWYGVAASEPDGFALDVSGYQPLLADFGITARWYPFNAAQVVIPALNANRGVLVVGDAHSLDARTYPRAGSGHAFVLTNYYTDEAGELILGFVGLDSNFARTEIAWPAERVEAAAAWGALNAVGYPVLVTDAPATWPSVARYYRQLRTGQLVPVF